MTIVTRFAPSPTGFLHIGGARTALFNWLFARHHGGRFLLRIEDTDRLRSTPEAVNAIIEGLRWLELDWDGEAISQAARADRHAEAAHQLVAAGLAYRCYASPAELAEMRTRAVAEGRSVRYDGRWRDRPASDAPPGVAPAIRLRAPETGTTTIADLVRGAVTVGNEQLDDMVLLRADGTPTYMLAVVVDDHDMGITHVMRGDDHFTNTFRQFQLYRAFGWTPPLFAHVPLIHGPDGGKLSKRHGALSVAAYRDEGFLPEAVCNYLLRLGWSHGDDEIIPRPQAIEWFDIEGIGRSPARFDRGRLLSLNAHYLREADDRRLTELALAYLRPRLGDRLSPHAARRLERGMASLKLRAKTVADLANNAVLYASCRPVAIDEKAARLLDAEARGWLADLATVLSALTDWSAASLEAAVRRYAEGRATEAGTFKAVAQALRAALAGAVASPPIFEVMEVLEREECLARIADAGYPAS